MSIDRCISCPMNAAYQLKLNGFFFKLSDSFSDTLFFVFVLVDGGKYF